MSFKFLTAELTELHREKQKTFLNHENPELHKILTQNQKLQEYAQCVFNAHILFK